LVEAFTFAFARAFRGIVGRFVGGLVVPLVGPLVGAFTALVGAFLSILSSKKVIGFGKLLDLHCDESDIVGCSWWGSLFLFFGGVNELFWR
jgi:hypothetical protein